MRKAVALIASAVLLAILSGCSYSGGKVAETSNGVSVYDMGTGGSVTLIELHDGDRAVRCAVLIGYSKGGISCDWEGTSE